MATHDGKTRRQSTPAQTNNTDDSAHNGKTDSTDRQRTQHAATHYGNARRSRTTAHASSTTAHHAGTAQRHRTTAQQRHEQQKQHCTTAHSGARPVVPVIGIRRASGQFSAALRVQPSSHKHQQRASRFHRQRSSRVFAAQLSPPPRGSLEKMVQVLALLTHISRLLTIAGMIDCWTMLTIWWIYGMPSGGVHAWACEV